VAPDVGHPWHVRPSGNADVAALDRLRATTEAGTGGRALFETISQLPGEILASERWPEGGTTLVVEQSDEIVAAARFLRIGSSTQATVAVAVAEVPGQREIGSGIIEALAIAAFQSGIEHFVADLLTANAVMLAMFVRAGFATEISVGDGVMHMSFSVDPTERDHGRSKVKAVPMWESTVGGGWSDPTSSPSRLASAG
jgi:hypothetical protein